SPYTTLFRSHRSGTDRAGEIQVDHTGNATGGDDVRGFQVQVEDTLYVQVVQQRRELVGQDGDVWVTDVAIIEHQSRQGRSAQRFHDDRGADRPVDHLVAAHEVRVAEGGQQSTLSQKLVQFLLVVGAARA